MLLTPTAVAFVALNALRILSVVSLILVFASTIESMALDGREVALAQPDDYEDCDYLPGTDVPTHAWGLFWAHLDRTFILILCLIGVLSEINWGGICERGFQHCLPIFSFAFGLAPLGSLQMMIGTNLLSHYLDSFPLVTSWLLFFVGLVNLLVGLIFARRGKVWRCLSIKDRHGWTGPSGMAQMIARQEYPAEKEGGSSGPPFYRHLNRATSQLGGGAGAQPVRSISQAFAAVRAAKKGGSQAQGAPAHHQDLSPSYEEVLRAQAREANERSERDYFGSQLRHGVKGNDLAADLESGRVLSCAFVYDSEAGHNIALGRPPSRGTDNSDNVAVRSFGTGSSTTAYGTTSRMTSKRQGKQRAVPTAAGYPRSPSSLSLAFKRRSLALAKAARRRLSSSSPSAASSSQRRYQRKAAPEMPSLRQRRLALAAVRQAERERDQLRRLANELRLPSSAKPGGRTDTSFLSPTSEYGPSAAPPATGTANAPTTIYSPGQSTTGLTSISRAQRRFGRDSEGAYSRYEAWYDAATVEPPAASRPSLEQPLPAYQPSVAGSQRERALRGGEDLGLGAGRLPVAARYESEWVEKLRS